MKNIRTSTTTYPAIHPSTEGQEATGRQMHGPRSSKVFIVVFFAALPALAAFVMWLADPQGVTALYATRTGQTLFYTGFIWMGFGMLAIRRMVFSRTVRPSLSPAW